jgi:hypothetical protein
MNLNVEKELTAMERMTGSSAWRSNYNSMTKTARARTASSSFPFYWRIMNSPGAG